MADKTSTDAHRQVRQLVQEMRTAERRGLPLYKLFFELDAMPIRPVVDELDRMLEDSRIWMRVRAAKLMGEVGRAGRPLLKRRVKRLASVFHDDPRLSVRMAAASGLGQLGHARDADVMLEAIDSPDRDIRLAVTQAISSVRSMKVAEALLRLTEDPDGEIREWALLGLSFYSRPRHAIVAACRSRLRDAYAPARYEAIRTLVVHRVPGSAKLLSAAVSEAGGDAILGWAVAELGEWAEQLQQELRSIRATVRERRR